MTDEITIDELAAQYAALEADNLALVTALRELENAVNHNVSGVKIDLGEWLRLISQARKALGHRVVTP